MSLTKHLAQIAMDSFRHVIVRRQLLGRSPVIKSGAERFDGDWCGLPAIAAVAVTDAVLCVASLTGSAGGKHGRTGASKHLAARCGKQGAG